jgi:hypothetical protein
MAILDESEDRAPHCEFLIIGMRSHHQHVHGRLRLFNASGITVVR